MILLDAVYTNEGGGKVLLDYLIIVLEGCEKNVFYLLDKRVEDNIPKIHHNKVIFLEANFLKRNNFYKKNKSKFSTILCFANLPPSIKTNSKVYTYFHQELYIKIPSTMSLQSKILFWLKTKILNLIKKNTDFWIVQSDRMKSELGDKYKIDGENILQIPFYPPLEDKESVERKKNTYLYVSNAYPHKNHINLIKAFCEFYDINKKGELILTVSEEYPEVFNFIEVKRNMGYPINNLKFVNREELSRIYSLSEFLVFPSFSESFGLGLVEAIENKCKVIAADLPYTFAACNPSIVFNPYDVESLVEALTLSLSENIKPSYSKINNEINKLIEILK